MVPYNKEVKQVNFALLPFFLFLIHEFNGKTFLIATRKAHEKKQIGLFVEDVTKTNLSESKKKYNALERATAYLKITVCFYTRNGGLPSDGQKPTPKSLYAFTL